MFTTRLRSDLFTLLLKPRVIQISCHEWFRLSTCTDLYAQRDDRSAFNGVNAVFSVFLELSKVRRRHVLFPRRGELDVDKLLQLVAIQ